ncbi:MAG: DNA polymerase I [Kiritimatiellia bacterium]
MSNSSNRLFIVDVMPLLYRGHFVFLRNPRLTTTGLNTSALYGFASAILQIIDEQKPTHLALAFDSATPTFRHQEFPAYKAQRQKAPEDLVAAIPMVVELARALRIPMLRVDGFEADDLMGTLARKAGAAGFITYLATPDKDVAQLVDERTFLFRPGKTGTPAEILGVGEVCTHWGLKSPLQMTDYLGMAGDSSDNIPGIAGVGEKTALTLLNQYGSLDSILEHASEIKGKLGEKVAASREIALISRQLATIRVDVPIEMSFDELKRQEPDREALKAALTKFELLQIGKRLLGSDFTVATAESFKTLADVPHDYRLAEGAELDVLLNALKQHSEWAFAVQAASSDVRRTRLTGLSFCVEPGKAWYVSMPPDRAASRILLERFRPLFEDAAKTKIGHDVKFSMSVLLAHGIRVAGALHDSMLEHAVLDAADKHTLAQEARQHLNYEPIPPSRLSEEKPGNLFEVEPPKMRDDAAEYADVSLQLHRRVYPIVLAEGAMRALEECEEPLVEVLIDMENAGVRIDPEVLLDYGRALGRELADLEAKIVKESGGDFNISSPKQLGDVLFDRLKLDPNATRTATGQYATNEEVLQKLIGKHAVVELILDHRTCSKLKSTYVDKLPECIDSRTGRIHTTFSQVLTETGRLSSYDPNLQNIPIRTERGRRIRAAFVPRDADHILVSADYSQIELRVMAALSGDTGLRDAFERGADIHTETAARVFDVMPGLVTPEMRSKCKMVNFGIIYGISPFGLAGRLGVPRKQAADLIEAYFVQYPGVKAYMDRTIVEAHTRGYVVTALGRRRFLRDIASRNATSRQAAERNAINTPVQGTAADLIKLAMVRLHRELRARKMGAQLVLQVHDELLLDVPRTEEAAVREIVRESMVHAMDLGVPIAIEMGSGENWLEAH